MRYNSLSKRGLVSWWYVLCGACLNVVCVQVSVAESAFRTSSIFFAKFCNSSQPQTEMKAAKRRGFLD